MTLDQFDRAVVRIRAALEAGQLGDAADMSARLAAEIKSERKRVDPKEVNFLGVPDEKLRRSVDPPFVALAASLDVAYYEHWRRGLDYDWHGYTRQATVEESKAQFDLLTGLIWHEYSVALDDADQAAAPADKIPERRRRDEPGGPTKREVSEAWMSARGVRLPASARQLLGGGRA